MHFDGFGGRWAGTGALFKHFVSQTGVGDFNFRAFSYFG